MKNFIYRVRNNEMSRTDAAILGLGIVLGIILIGVLLTQMGVNIKID